MRLVNLLVVIGLGLVGYGLLHVIAAFGGAGSVRASELLSTGVVLWGVGCATIVVASLVDERLS